ncbi:hypothetical protein MNBD_GAMMA10-796 [hydrothermal vent metagenome]|uniref:Tox-MPTase3 domain-containing protein n=1 Tax=hydrothermal vent metagenome TaxID=652676 RepID=A0A3B0YCN0_9ZZZZ
MKISISDQKKYPNFTKYVRRQLPKLKGVPKVIRNLNNSGHLDEKEAASALTWGNLPLIRITDLYSGQCGVPKAYGCFRHKNKDRIEIHTQIVKDFENIAAGITNKNKKGKALYVVGATLLHELCHWGNYNNSPRVIETKEMGANFEKRTYGKIIY